MTNNLPTMDDLRASWKADGAPEGLTRVYHDLIYDFRKLEEMFTKKAQRFAADAEDTAKKIARGDCVDSLGFAYAARDAAELESLRGRVMVLKEKAESVRTILEAA